MANNMMNENKTTEPAEYTIRIISDEAALNDCPVFYVDQYNWGGTYKPKTYGRLAYIEDFGFILSLCCEESNPFRTYTNFQDPVYLDSAVEAFFDFNPESKKGTYVNFEMNSNAAMLNNFGTLRPDRHDTREYTSHRAQCTADIKDNLWSVTLRIPNAYIGDLFGKDSFKSGDIIRCNFYKICESKNAPCPEHYASFAPIRTASPDFHRPEFFAYARISK